MRTVAPDVAARIEEEELLVEVAYRKERLRIFRMRLQAHIRSVSPLVRDLADARGIGLPGVVDLLRPYPELLRSASLLPTGAPRLRPAAVHSVKRPKLHPWMRTSDMRVSYAVSRKGIVLDAKSGSGDLGFMVHRGSLIAAGWLGGSWFHTEGDRAHVVLQVDVPETLVAAAVGRSIGQIVSHAVFDGREYPITRAVCVEEAQAVAFTFHTGEIAYELPWPELLRFDGLGEPAVAALSGTRPVALRPSYVDDDPAIVLDDLLGLKR